ncbi:hypothetical protein [Methylobacterium soli]|uniref:Uncharacterized protein n=1 Tax=Methylobacterium soli TaxID=553447 RepID=A0A6L3T195_9HYPH|nr:hypothetical protein [Methylobacterium soli]KAB1079753.1 hypothetical protein F6X53_08245 [Methylobacterium soli]
MTVRTLVLAAVASVTLAGTALADDRLNLTPPLYREQARATATLRPASELTTTPSVTARAPTTRRVVAEAADTAAH